MHKLVSKNPNTYCLIDPTGARVHELYIDGIKILWGGSRPDGGLGSTHPCIPNFNPAAGLPQHGPARKALWQQQDEQSFTWTMEAVPQVYPSGLVCSRVFTIFDQGLSIDQVISNESDQPLMINIGEHPYFVCNNNDRSKVKINNDMFSDNSLNGGTDYIEALDTNIISIPSVGKITLLLVGYSHFALWSLPEADFVCIEPIQMIPPDENEFAHKACTLKPNKQQQFHLSFQKV